MLGGGGMGVVYRARDRTLGRVVALKFLTPESSRSPEARRRFLTEARAASALDHPNICTVHEIAEAEDGSLYIAMACYDGETLDARLRRGPLSTGDALDIATQIAGALAAAHAHGIVHRDTKPANVFLTREGVAKLLDFGIARTGDSGANAPPNAPAGTLVYMSPEQVRGDEPAPSTDVWAFGAMLYEMLTGDRAFRGDTPDGLIRAVLHVDPDWRALPAADRVGTVVRTALQKDPADRYGSGQELLDALHDSGARDAQGPQSGIGAQKAGSGVGHARVMVAGVVVAIAGIAFLVQRSPSAVERSVPVPHQISFSGKVLETSMSPDGRLAALVLQQGDSQALDVVTLDDRSSRPLYREPGFLCCPAWSPDASRIVFRTRSGTKVLRIDGVAGPRDVDARNVAAWSPDGTKLYSWWPQAGEITLTDVATGDSTSIPLRFPYDWISGVHWSPRTDQIVLAVRAPTRKASLWTLMADGSHPQRILEDTIQLYSPHWAPRESALYYFRALETAELWKVWLDRDGSVRGEPRRIDAGLSPFTRNRTLVFYSVASVGNRLLYPRRTARSNLWRLPLNGRAGEPRQLTSGTALRMAPRISPDGSTIAFVEIAGGAAHLQLLSSGSVEPVTIAATPAKRWSPAWSAAGDRLAVGTLIGDSDDVTIVDRKGQERQVLRGTQIDPDNHLSWLGTDRIAYVQRDDRNIRVVNLKDESERAVLPDGVTGWFYELRSSPDGAELAVWWSRSNLEVMAIISVAEGSIEVIAPDQVPIGWAPDGEFVYTMSSQNRRDGGSRQIFRVRRGGGEPISVLTLPGTAEAWDVAVSPDGGWIVAALDESTSDAWLIDDFDPTRR